MRHASTAGCFVSAILIGAGGAFAQTWGRPSTPAVGACFYEGRSFTGQYFCAKIGESSKEVPVGTNDRISSIRVYGSAEVVVYKDVNFHGTAKRFDYNISDLRSEGWNDKISSFSVGSHGYSPGGFGSGFSGNWTGPTPGSGACFYEHPNFGGRYFCSNVGATTPVAPEGTNDKISSIRLYGNVSVTVFQDARFEGRSERFDFDMRNLSSRGWDDLISSFRVTRRGFGAEGKLQVYADINYKGKSVSLDPSTPDVAARGMGALISSIRVPSGETWQVCTGTNFTGRCQTLTGDASDLRRGDWNDKIASVQRVR